MKSFSVPRIGTAAFVVGSILGTYFWSGPRNRKSRNQVFWKQQKKLDKNLIAPANATFGVVWPVIYLGTTALAVHQALPSQQDNPRYQKAMPWFWVSYGLNALFGYYFSSGDKFSRVAAGITTLATLPPALGLHRALEIGTTQPPQPERTLHKAVSLYAGWVTAASVVSTSNLLLEASYKPTRQQAVPLAEAVLGLTGALGVGVARQLNDPYYMLPFAAAFTGVAAKQYRKKTSVAGVAGALAVATLAWAGVQLWRNYRKDAATESTYALPEDNPQVADTQTELVQTGAAVDIP